MKKTSPNSGFTLVELSIVIVIIGLLVGGLVTGRELVHASAMRAQIKELQGYDEAFSLFRDKYNAIPGDFAGSAAVLPGTVNGNGNGIVDLSQTTGYDAGGGASWAGSPEAQQFFVQLTKAGMLPGSFDGTPVIGQGLPHVALNDRGTFFVGGPENFVGSRNPDISNLRKGNNFMWIIACGTTGTLTLGDNMQIWDDFCAIFDPATLYSIDEKIDDALPLSGRLLGFGGFTSSNNCLNGNDYNRTLTSRECQAAYMLN